MNPDRVRLRDVVLADADLIDSWESPAIRGEFNDFGEPPGPMPRDVLAAGPLRNDHNGMLNAQADALGQIAGGPLLGWLAVAVGSTRPAMLAVALILVPSLYLYLRTIRLHGRDLVVDEVVP